MPRDNGYQLFCTYKKVIFSSFARTKYTTLLLISLLASISFVLFDGGVAQAATAIAQFPYCLNAYTSSISSSCSNLKGYYDGISLPSSSDAWGAQAYITNYNPHICQSSSAWSLIGNINDPSGQELAQIGYLKFSSWSTSTVYYFYEYGQAGILYYPVMDGIDVNFGNQDKFTVYTDTSTGYTLFNIADNNQFSVKLNWTANTAQWFAETHYTEDQTVGGKSHVVTFSTVQHLYSGRWYNDNASQEKSNNQPNASGSWPNSNTFSVWDIRYN